MQGDSEKSQWVITLTSGDAYQTFKRQRRGEKRRRLQEQRTKNRGRESEQCFSHVWILLRDSVLDSCFSFVFFFLTLSSLRVVSFPWNGRGIELRVCVFPSMFCSVSRLKYKNFWQTWLQSDQNERRRESNISFFLFLLSVLLDFLQDSDFPYQTTLLPKVICPKKILHTLPPLLQQKILKI